MFTEVIESAVRLRNLYELRGMELFDKESSLSDKDWSEHLRRSMEGGGWYVFYTYINEQLCRLNGLFLVSPNLKDIPRKDDNWVVEDILSKVNRIKSATGQMVRYYKKLLKPDLHRTTRFEIMKKIDKSLGVCENAMGRLVALHRLYQIKGVVDEAIST